MTIFSALLLLPPPQPKYFLQHWAIEHRYFLVF